MPVKNPDNFVEALFVADAARLEAISPILQSVIYATASVVGVYMGLSTWAEKR